MRDHVDKVSFCSVFNKEESCKVQIGYRKLTHNLEEIERQEKNTSYYRCINSLSTVLSITVVNYLYIISILRRKKMTFGETFLFLTFC